MSQMSHMFDLFQSTADSMMSLSTLAATGVVPGAADAATDVGATDTTGGSWLQTVQRGGIVAWVIIAMSVVALGLSVMHFWQIRREQLMPQSQLENLERLLKEHRVSEAHDYCMHAGNASYLTRILGAGLTRFQRSAFGVFEVKDAIEEAGEDQTARLYRSTDAIGVIASIAPLLGLLGTVLGMVGAFDQLSRSAGSQSEKLAANISVALVTTLLGLMLAIPCSALFTFFRNRIDGLASEASVEIERLCLHLEEGQATGGGAPASGGPGGAGTPGGRPKPRGPIPVAGPRG